LILQRNFFLLRLRHQIKPPQPSSAIYGAPPFTGNPQKDIACLCKLPIYFTNVTGVMSLTPSFSFM